MVAVPVQLVTNVAKMVDVWNHTTDALKTLVTCTSHIDVKVEKLAFMRVEYVTVGGTVLAERTKPIA